MRFKLTLFLIVANLAMFGLIWKNAGGNAETEISAQSIFSSDISQVSVRDANGAVAFSLERNGLDWSVEKPFPWRANPFAVKSLLDELRFLDAGLGFSVEEVAGAGNTLSSYGLEKPAAVVSVRDSAGTRELFIGNTTTDGRSVYVLSPDKKSIIPAPMSLLNAISQTPDELRTREVFSVRPYEVRAVTVRTAFSGGSEQRIGLVRSRNGNGAADAKSQWNFETPVSAAADTQLTEKALGELCALACVRFVPGDAATNDSFGLKTPALRFTLDTGNRSRTLLVGAEDSGNHSEKTRFAKLEDNPAVFTVPAKTVDAWRSAAHDLRDPFFLRFRPEELIGITIHDGKNSLVLHRMNVVRDDGNAGTENDAGTSTGTAFVGAVAEPAPELLSAKTAAASNPLYNSWQMPVAPGSAVTAATPVAPEIVAGLISELRDLRAVRAPGADNPEFSAAQRRLCEAFVADVATPEDIEQMKFNTPLRIVELEFLAPNGRSRPQTLSIAPAAEKDTPIHAKMGTAIYSVSPEILDALVVSPAHFRERLVYSLPAGGKIVAVKLSEIDGSHEKILFEEKRPDNVADWAAALEKDAGPFPQALAGLLRAVETVTAESFLPGNFSRDFTDSSYLDSGVPETWRYKLEVRVLLADGEKTPGKTETLVYYLTRRLGGTTQLAGSPSKDCIFRIRQDFIDALHALTFNRSGIIPNIDVPEGVPANNLLPAD